MRFRFLALLFFAVASQAAVITSWNFNSDQADGSTTTGRLEPSTGNGAMAIVGGLSQAFGSVAGGATSDPNSGDNSQLRLSSFPAQASGNKTAGLEFRASTDGFENIRLVWDHENSGSASRYWRVQYTLDGSTWNDHQVFTNNNAGSWLLERAISFQTIAGANNNANFGVRMVAEFEDSATGAGVSEYRAVNATGNYSSAGTFWVDTVRIEGDPPGGGEPPPPNRDSIAHWDFNSSTADNDATTGTLVNRVGVAAIPLGGVAATFGSVAGGNTSDPATADNSMLRVAGFPPRTEANKEAGIEFRASTVGYRNIVLAWDQYNSNTGSRYWRIQYTLNGTEFVDHLVFTNPAAATWHRANTVSFAGIPGVDQNPAFAVRIVAEFESSATGAGEEGYDAVNPTSTYSAAGTLWLDSVRLAGEAASGNVPVISAIPDVTLREGLDAEPLLFTISDLETAVDQLTVNGTSNNPDLVQSILFEGSGANRTARIITAGGILGTAEITITVVDADGLTASQRFRFTVLPANTPPSITLASRFDAVVNTGSFSVSFSVQDLEQGGEALTITARSSNHELVSDEGLRVEGIAEERKLFLTPLPDVTGRSVVTVTVSDGSLEASAEILVRVAPPELIAEWDFNGSVEPSFGSASLQTIGSLNGAIAKLTSQSSDVATDNSMLRLSDFPAQGSGNKTAGIEIRASTAGRRKMSFAWDHYNSGTASRYWRLLYSTNGIDFHAHLVFTNSSPGNWRDQRTVSFEGLPGVEDNPSFALRFVSEFEGTATGEGGDFYAASQNNAGYSGAGVLWLDMISLRGETIPPPNTPPSISAVAAHIIRENTETAPLPFTVIDRETSPGDLRVSATSSNPELLAEILLQGEGTNRAITLRPAPFQSGQAVVTVRVTDTEGLYADSSFTIIVLQANTPPTISAISSSSLTEAGSPLRIPFSLSDREQMAEQLVTSARCSRPELVTIQIEGNGLNRELVVTPGLGKVGSATIFIAVSDAFVSTETSFQIDILPVEPPKLSLNLDGIELVIQWTVPPGIFLLEAADELSAGWNAYSFESQESNIHIARIQCTGPAKFFRLKR